MPRATPEQTQDRIETKKRIEQKTFVPNKPLGLCYLRGECWLPYAIAERLTFTGALILISALADLRKLSPELALPAVLPDNLRASWWELTVGWTNSPVQRMLATSGELTTTAAPPLPPIELKPDPFSDAAKETKMVPYMILIHFLPL